MASKRKLDGEIVDINPKKFYLSTKEGECWQRALGTPGERLAASYNLSKLTDLTLTFPGNHETLKVHRFVLAMSSPVFECMLYGPMAEGVQIELPEDPPEAFRWLTEYIYFGKTNLPSVTVGVQVYHLASKYQMDALSTLCSQFLIQQLNGSNLPLIYETADLLGDSSLINECSKIMSFSAEAVLSSPNIGQLSYHYMKHFLQQPLCISSEVSVFKGLVAWGRAQVRQSSQKSVKEKELRQKIAQYLPLVRFLTMTLDEFVEHVMPSNILTPEENNSILMNIKGVKNIPLPQICQQTAAKARFVLDWRMTQKLTFSQRKNCFTSINQTSKEARRNLITNLKFTKNICLGRIVLRFYNNVQYDRWIIEVTDSSGVLIGKVKENVTQDPPTSAIRSCCQINGTFSMPLFLSSDRVYNIWLHCISMQEASGAVSSQCNTLSVTATQRFSGQTDINFWFLDESSSARK